MNERAEAVPPRGHGLRFGPPSLNTQIDEALQRVRERHHAIGVCFTSLRGHARMRATSGAGLMLAASIGFIAAECARLLDAGARARSTPGPRGTMLKGASRAVRWGRLLFTIFP